MDKYCENDSSLNNSYEAKFLRNIINAIKAGNGETFQDEVFKLSSRMNIDRQKQDMLEVVLARITKKGTNVLEEDYNPF